SQARACDLAEYRVSSNQAHQALPPSTSRLRFASAMGLYGFSPRCGLVLAAIALFANAPDVSAAITCAVAKVELPDDYSGQQLLVSDNDRDITREATYSSSNEAVAKVDAK